MIAGFDYIKQHALSVDDHFLLEETLYTDLKNSKIGLTRDEANLFELITTNLTIQHASPINKAHGESLKSITQREITGDTVEYKRTGNRSGRQNFVYFVTGIGDQVNAPGLEKLNTYQIDLNKLALHNPQKFSQLYVSPHLSEFDTNAHASPCIMGGTRIDIQFDGEHQNITYRFQRSNGEIILEKTYHLHDFVFFGGSDVLTGIAFRFIELLRFVGNPYRQHFLTQLADQSIPKQQKIQLLSTAMTALMPGSMLIEAKIPQEILLNNAYTRITTPEIKTGEHALLSNDNVHFEGNSLYVNDDLTQSPFVLHLQKYMHDFATSAGIDFTDKKAKKRFSSILNKILTEVCCNGPYSIDVPNFTGHIPIDLNLFFTKLIYSSNEFSLPFIKWLLTTSFESPYDKELHYLLNVNQRESSGTSNLFISILSTRYKDEKHTKLLNMVYPLLTEKTVRFYFWHYVAVAAHESFGNISTSEDISFLLEKNIPLTDKDHPNLLSWIEFENNEKLLEYMFINQSLNINAMVNNYSWLEHAVLNKNKGAANWLLDHGAVLHRHHPKVLSAMSEDLKSRLGLAIDKDHEQCGSDETVSRDAAIVIVTANYYNGDTYTIMGRRRVDNKLEEQWSFPGGIIDDGETVTEAAIRELSEETTVVIDPEKATIQEIMRVKLNPLHQKQDNIGNLIFIHIDLGKTLLPSVWPGSDLGEVTKMKTIENSSTESLRKHKTFPIRASNHLLLDYLGEQKQSPHPEEFSSLLFAEMYPLQFVQYYMKLINHIDKFLSDNAPSYCPFDELDSIEEDKTALLLLRATTIDMLQHCLHKISHTIDHTIKASILSEAIDSSDVQFLNFLLENGYSNDLLQNVQSCELNCLITDRKWDMLHFICKNAPHMLHVGKHSWNGKDGVSSLIGSIPSDEIKKHIKEMNADNIIFNQLMHLYKKQINDADEQRELTLTTIKNMLKAHPEAIKNFTIDHIKLILLSGDVELFKVCYKEPQFADLSYDSEFFYSFYIPPHYDDINILKYLFTNKHAQMLIFLHEKFPKLRLKLIDPNQSTSSSIDSGHDEDESNSKSNFSNWGSFGYKSSKFDWDDSSSDSEDDTESYSEDDEQQENSDNDKPKGKI